ncbi:hypothetical protein FB451DRAFT_354903 [Mycena latifolia]|nr:hypothetical protein FB451DRAFT_354903 [Mycena latifolia]
MTSFERPDLRSLLWLSTLKIVSCGSCWQLAGKICVARRRFLKISFARGQAAGYSCVDISLASSILNSTAETTPPSSSGFSLSFLQHPSRYIRSKFSSAREQNTCMYT